MHLANVTLGNPTTTKLAIHVFSCFRRIREKRQLKVMESREKRKVEKPRMPRTAKKVERKRLEGEMAEMGVDIENPDEVSRLKFL